MTRRNFLIPLSMLLGSVVMANARQPGPIPLPQRGPSPLLFLRFVGPEGMKATFYPGTRAARSFDAPAAIGVRTGYVIRVQLDHFRAAPDLTLFPSVEVRGGLWLGAKLNAADYPAPVVLTDADLESIRNGALVTKAIYLENPDQAAPVATKPDDPIELSLAVDRDPLQEARRMGRPIAVVRFGGRTVPPEELARFAVPGTVLLPGEHGLMPAAAPPCLLLADLGFLDPRYGPKPPEEECLRDGGNEGHHAGLDSAGQLRGMQPSDTVAEYTDPAGHRRITSSNRVCICVPRFGVLRVETPFGRYDSVLTAGDTRSVMAQESVKARQPAHLAGQVDQLKAVKMRERPSIWTAQITIGRSARVEVLQAHHLELGPLAAIGSRAIYTVREEDRLRLARQMELARELSRREGIEETASLTTTSVTGRVQGGAEVLSAAVETRDFTVCCNEEPRVPDKPLVLYKCADRPAAKVGDVVTFTLRYSNHGGRPLTDVALSDSLTGRLEYVPGSARSDRDAVFTMQENEAGSWLLRWEISGKLLPGDSGAVTFQARVR